MTTMIQRSVVGVAMMLALMGCSQSGNNHPMDSTAEEGTSLPQLRIATFNVSMEAENYLLRGERGDEQVLIERLASGDEPQIRNVAEIIQRVRPDILLLTEFDYIEDPAQGVEAFLSNYLHKGQGEQEALDYPYYFYAPVNTGQPSPYDLNRSGEATGSGADAWGFGHYPGQYGMLILSKYPIDKAAIRTFQDFKWKDMPGHLTTKTADGQPWYSDDAWAEFPLSSKSHWDVPIMIDTERLHILASHPTPPVFDGPENRNGLRNHDEIRFWQDYIEGADYFYDDQGQTGGFKGSAPFVIAGDLNASADEGDGLTQGIANLLGSELVQGQVVPTSRGGLEHSSRRVAEGLVSAEVAGSHTASWRMRADYVIPSSTGLQVVDNGVFWPAADEDGYHLVADRAASSDHRLVWVDAQLTH